MLRSGNRVELTRYAIRRGLSSHSVRELGCRANPDRVSTRKGFALRAATPAAADP
jgi:hypothetical protein